VAINELADMASVAHLTRYDSTHGRFFGSVSAEGDVLRVNGDPIQVLSEGDISRLPWGRIGVDVVLECTGTFTDREIAARHLGAGAGKVIFSCPAQKDVDATVVYGLNESCLRKEHTIISNASCTSNCIAHVIRALDATLGIEAGVITTVHSAMNDQTVIDAFRGRDLRKCRGATTSIVPVGTGLEKGIDRLFPHLRGRFEAIAVRVPTINVSAMQLSARLRIPTDAETVNRILQTAAASLEGIFGYSEEPLVSADFNHDPRSAVVDAGQTRVAGGTLVSVMAWFDNEWGYANRMIDTCLALARAV
jgi:glyceraldehyde-3-phosphate dehydrogenase type I